MKFSAVVSGVAGSARPGLSTGRFGKNPWIPSTVQSRALCESTGYEEFSLSSLSTSDYTGLSELLPRLLDWAEPEHTNISLPSLRVDGFSEELQPASTCFAAAV